MPNKASKIETYIRETKTKTNTELANEELIKLFGTKENYVRYLLINYNKNMTSAFCARRADGLYVSCDMAQRDFLSEMQRRFGKLSEADSYENFTRFHNSTRFDYPVVQTAFDNFFMQEVAMFCCGALESDGYYRKKGYYDQFRDGDSKLVLTPQIVKINTDHPNYKIIKELTIDRQKNSPFLYMDDKTLAAFTCFRIMVYNKTLQNMQNGVADRVPSAKYPQVYNRNYNPYLCYAIALQDTCEYFKKFYNPNQVQFTDAKLPYKGLAVIQTKLDAISLKYGIPTIGTISHFDVAKNLPWIVQDIKPITKLITKMVDFKGKRLTEFEYNTQFIPAYNKNAAIINIQENQNIKVPKAAPTNVAAVKESTELAHEIDEALAKTTRIIKGEYTFEYGKNIENTVSIVEARLQKLSGIKVNRSSDFLNKVVREIEMFKRRDQRQLPMFFEVAVGIERITVGNTIGFIDSQKMLPFTEKFYGVNKKYNEIVDTYKKIQKLGASLNSIASEYAYAKKDYDNPPPLDPKQESEIYRWKDPISGQFVSGSYEEYEFERCKQEYINVYDELIAVIEKANALSSEFAIMLDETKFAAQELMTENLVSESDLEGAIEVLSQLDGSEVMSNVIDIND